MFRMTVQDVFSIKRRGLVATGQIESGTVRVGDELQIDGLGTTRVKALEMFRKQLDEAKAGDTVGLLLDGVEREDIGSGAVLTGQSRGGSGMTGAEGIGLT